MSVVSEMQIADQCGCHENAFMHSLALEARHSKLEAHSETKAIFPEYSSIYEYRDPMDVELINPWFLIILVFSALSLSLRPLFRNYDPFNENRFVTLGTPLHSNNTRAWNSRSAFLKYQINRWTLGIRIQSMLGESNCAYCKDKFTDSKLLIKCPSCDTLHHSDCYSLNEGCSVFGCPSTALIRSN
jgi:hypothetical protein